MPMLRDPNVRNPKQHPDEQANFSTTPRFHFGAISEVSDEPRVAIADIRKAHPR
jgi:hypothetical protein